MAFVGRLTIYTPNISRYFASGPGRFAAMPYNTSRLPSVRRRWILGGAITGTPLMFLLGFSLLHLRIDARRIHVGQLVQRAANRDATAVAELRQCRLEDLPELCRIIAAGRRTPWDLQAEIWRDRFPKPLRGVFPDHSLREAKAMQARNAVGSIPEWGTGFVAVIRADCSSPAADSARRPLMQLAASAVRKDPIQHSNPETVAAFIAGLTNSSPWTRVFSVFALASIGPAASNAAPSLRSRFNDAGRTVGQHAAFAVWQTTGERLQPLEVLFSSLGSAEIETLKATVRNIHQIAPSAARELPSERALLADNPNVRASRRNLPYHGGPGGPRARRYLEQCQSSPDVDVAAAAKAALIRLREAELPPHN